MDTQAGRENHPLNDKNICRLGNWEEFLALWKSTTHAEALVGLLHAGFRVPVGLCFEKRILFYLEIADGHLRTTIHPDVSRKAFEVLAIWFFKFNNAVRATLQREDLVRKVLWFFRTSPNGYMPNLPRPDHSHHTRIAWEFLHGFCRAFYTHRVKDCPVKEQRARFALELVELLWAMENLEELTDSVLYSEADELCLRALQHFSTKKPGQSMYGIPRSYDTLDEALLNNVQSARVYVLLKCINDARKRTEEHAKLGQARQQLDEAELRLAQTASKFLN